MNLIKFFIAKRTELTINLHIEIFLNIIPVQLPGNSTKLKLLIYVNHP